ncbi:MAG TPA: TPM domain-containing protein [Bacteroidia bacterium]|nr:TPM domain-containing protein [Bacteroidia bacterium]
MSKFLSLYFFALLSFSVFAGELPKKPNTLVNDYAGVLSASQEAELESMLRAYDDSTSNQIAIAIEGSLDGEDPFKRSVDIAESWGVGDETNDNGVLIYVAINDRQMFVQVGRGLEGAIPDALAGRIIDYEIKPAFKAGNYYEGLQKGSIAVMKAAAGEYKAKERNKKDKGFPTWMVILFVIFIVLISKFGRMLRGRSGTYSRGGYIGGTGWGGGWSGGGGSSFGGFGGGSFGGGGAGGSW